MEIITANHPKLLILGYAESGKTLAATFLQDSFEGFRFKDSSLAAAEIFIYDALKDKYGYTDFNECYNDRKNRRKEWHDLITEYNKDDASRLAKDIMRENSCYVGMRSLREIEKCVEEKLFNAVIWIDASERIPDESIESCSIRLDDIRSMVTMIIDNNGSEGDFLTTVGYMYQRILVRHQLS